MDNVGFIQEIEKAAEDMRALFDQGGKFEVPSPKM